MGKICSTYFDDIYIYTTDDDVEKHVQALRKVFKRLKKNGLYVSLSKCVFCAEEIPVLGDYVGRNSVRISPDKARIIREWPRPKTKSELQSFMGTCVYVKRFCKNYGELSAPVLELQKQKARKLNWNERAIAGFEGLKAALSSPPVLKIADFSKPFRIRCDGSEFAIGGELLQEHDGKFAPVAFCGRQLNAAERRYPIREIELLAIVEALKAWRVYLLDKPFIVETDHESLSKLLSQQTISKRVCRWYDLLSEYPIRFAYIPGETNVVSDAISRRPDFVPERPLTLDDDKNLPVATDPSVIPTVADKPTTINLSLEGGRVWNFLFINSNDQLHMELDGNETVEIKVQTGMTTTKPILERVVESRRSDKEYMRIYNGLKTRTWPKDVAYKERYSLQEDLVYYLSPIDDDGIPRLVIPEDPDLRNDIMWQFHDTPMAGHPGVKRTELSVADYYYWPNIYKSIKRYVATCETCIRAKRRAGKKPGKLRPLEIPKGRWVSIGIDFIVKLPKSKEGNDSIMVIVDRLTKRAHFVPFKEATDAPELARIFMREYVRLHGIPYEIVSDCVAG